MALIDGLTRALVRAGIPITGVSMPTVSDRSTWRIDYLPEATDDQKATAESLKLTYDVATDTVWTDEQAAAAMMGQISKALCALMLDVKLNRRLTTADIPTVQAMFTQAQAYYKFIVTNNL